MNCIEPNCDREAKWRGRCLSCYHRWRIGPEFVRFVPHTPGKCSVDGCKNIEKAGGICNMHYQRRRRERLRKPCVPGRKTHEYSTHGRCIYCGTKRLRKWVPDPRTGRHKPKGIDTPPELT